MINVNDDKLRDTIVTVKGQYLYYFIIGIVSFVALVFLPMLGSEAISVINILLFDCFRKQAKLNVRNNERFIEANEILLKNSNKIKRPRSPGKYNLEIWGKKGTSIFLSSLLATVALTQALLMYDWISMLTYLFTITMGIVFGIIQMKNDEIYWTEEYYSYALSIKEENDDNSRQ